MPAAEAHRHRAYPAAVAALCALMWLCRPAAAAEDTQQDPQAQLQSVEKAIEDSRQEQQRRADEAAALAGEVARLRAASVAAAKAVQQHEAALSDLEAQLARLTEAEKAASEDLRRRSGESVELLMALERLARDPPEAAIVAPTSPLDAARGAILLGAAIPQIAEKAHRLRGELAALAALRRETASKQQRLAAERDSLAQQQAALAELTARKAQLQEAASQDAALSAQRIGELSAEASGLRDLIARLEAERQRQEEQRRVERELRARAARQPPRPTATARGSETRDAAVVALAKPPGLRSFSEAHGAMLLPAAGKITLRFGEDDQYGNPNKGVSLTTRPGAQVVAPFDGRIEFAGPFRGYGQILIIEHGDGYHSLLAGLERTEGVVGQWVVAGEPVGVMPSGASDPVLYLELRHHGTPINPLPWLATSDDKVSG